MTIVIIVVLAVIVVAALAFGAWQFVQRRRTQQLQDRFGPEYDRAVDQYGSKADSVLADRQKKVEQYDIRPLSADDRSRFTEEWDVIQRQFVDDPSGAVEGADRVIRDVMTTVGYPAGAFDQREEAASVQYPDVVQNYRRAHQISQAKEDGDVSTEDLRGAMVLYRSLFTRLVGTPVEAGASSGAPS